MYVLVFVDMKTFIFLLVLNEILVVTVATTNNRKTFLMSNKATDIFLKRSKRYLVFEKGASLSVQGNIAKSIIPPAPRGLNVIAEYTLNYDLPTDFYFFKNKKIKTTNKPKTTIQTPHSYIYYPHDMIIPYNHDHYDHYYKMHPDFSTEKMIKRKNSYPRKKIMMTQKCLRKSFYDYKRKSPESVCLKRDKRNRNWSVSDLSISERMFYDLIEKWSLLHGFLPRYCFMRTLCESSELLLPYGHSLLHDIIHILLRYTKPWAFHHKIFGRSLRQRYPIDECAKLYGPYCRVSWLDFITNVVYGSRAVDFIR